jgi:F-type H+-transporting ATPase subunit beta
MTQNFGVAEGQRGKKGVYVDVASTVADAKDIIEGKYDKVPEQKFLFVGSAKEVLKSTKEL